VKPSPALGGSLALPGGFVAVAACSYTASEQGLVGGLCAWLALLSAEVFEVTRTPSMHLLHTNTQTLHPNLQSLKVTPSTGKMLHQDNVSWLMGDD